MFFSMGFPWPGEEKFKVLDPDSRKRIKIFSSSHFIKRIIKNEALNHVVARILSL